MSEQSYQLNVKDGVTTADTGTCLPASFDRLSKHVGVSKETYIAYGEAFEAGEAFAAVMEDSGVAEYAEIVRQNREVYAKVMADLGVYTMKNVVCLKADTESQLRTTLANLTQGGFRIAIDLDLGDAVHTVGVAKVGEDYYDAVSNWTPFEADQPVSVCDLYRFLNLPERYKTRPRGKRTYRDTNISALPPEPRR